MNCALPSGLSCLHHLGARDGVIVGLWPFGGSGHNYLAEMLYGAADACVEAGVLTGVHSRLVGGQDLGAVWTRILELFLLQRTVQVAANRGQFRRDGQLAEVRAHSLWV